MRRLAFILPLFFIDLRVRAADVVTTTETRRALAVGSARAELGPRGLAVIDGTTLKLVRGRAYVEGGLTLTTPFARFSCEGESCRALVRRDESGVSLAALSDGWSVIRTGEQNRLGIDNATRVVVGEVDRDGRAALEPPQSLAWSSLVREWAALYPHPAERFLETVRAFRPGWTESVERLSADQAGRALAMVGTAERARLRVADSERARAAEDAAIRRQFREMNFAE